MSHTQIRQLCIIANFKKVKKGEILDLSDPDQSFIYLLKKGNLKIVQVDENGNELIVDLIYQGEIFGELKNSSSSNPSEYAQVLSEKVVLCRFKAADFEKLLEQYPSLAISYSKIVGFRLKRVKNKYSNLFFLNTKERLIAFLKEWAKREVQDLNGSITLSNYLTHKDISQIICASRQTTTQLFNDWEKTGKIRYSRKEIFIKSLEEL
ncbi:MAG: Crp/Fnr family transcriptional regulator [Algoriphagus sp.]|nr:Crp/Fnr family transcriptional regulator [Algoriphagus sp.]